MTNATNNYQISLTTDNEGEVSNKETVKSINKQFKLNLSQKKIVECSIELTQITADKEKIKYLTNLVGSIIQADTTSQKQTREIKVLPVTETEAKLPKATLRTSHQGSKNGGSPTERSRTSSKADVVDKAIVKTLIKKFEQSPEKFQPTTQEEIQAGEFSVSEIASAFEPSPATESGPSTAKGKQAIKVAALNLGKLPRENTESEPGPKSARINRDNISPTRPTSQTARESSNSNNRLYNLGNHARPTEKKDGDLNEYHSPELFSNNNGSFDESLKKVLERGENGELKAKYVAIKKSNKRDKDLDELRRKLAEDNKKFKFLNPQNFIKPQELVALAKEKFEANAAKNANFALANELENSDLYLEFNMYKSDLNGVKNNLDNYLSDLFKQIKSNTSNDAQIKIEFVSKKGNILEPLLLRTASKYTEFSIHDDSIAESNIRDYGTKIRIKFEDLEKLQNSNIKASRNLYKKLTADKDCKIVAKPKENLPQDQSEAQNNPVKQALIEAFDKLVAEKTKYFSSTLQRFFYEENLKLLQNHQNLKTLFEVGVLPSEATIQNTSRKNQTQIKPEESELQKRLNEIKKSFETESFETESNSNSNKENKNQQAQQTIQEYLKTQITNYSQPKQGSQTTTQKFPGITIKNNELKIEQKTIEEAKLLSTVEAIQLQKKGLYAVDNLAIYPFESQFLSNQRLQQLFAENISQSQITEIEAKIKRENSTFNPNINPNINPSNKPTLTNFEVLRALKSLEVSEDLRNELEANLGGNKLASWQQNSAKLFEEEILSEIANGNSKKRSKPIISADTGEGKSFYLEKFVANYQNFVSEIENNKNFESYLENNVFKGLEQQGITIFDDSTENLKIVKDIKENQDKYKKLYQLYENDFRVININLANQGELDNIEQFKETNKNKKTKNKEKPLFGAVINIDEALFIDDYSQKIRQLVDAGAKVQVIGATLNFAKTLEDSSTKLNKSEAQRKIAEIENEIRDLEANKNKQNKSKLEDNLFDNELIEGRTEILNKKLKEEKTKLAADKEHQNLSQKQKTNQDNLNAIKNRRAKTEAKIKGSTLDPKKDLNLNNWQELVGDLNADKNIQIIIPNHQLKPTENDKEKLQNLANTNHKLVLANFVENGKHRIAVFEEGKKPEIFDAGSKEFNAYANQNKNKKAIMIYAGAKNQFAVGGDYCVFSVLEKNDEQKIILSKDEQVDIDLIKQMIGRNRSQEPTSISFIVDNGLKIKDAENLATKAQEKRFEKEVSTYATHLKNKIEKKYGAKNLNLEKILSDQTYINDENILNAGGDLVGNKYKGEIAGLKFDSQTDDSKISDRSFVTKCQLQKNGNETLLGVDDFSKNDDQNLKLNRDVKSYIFWQTILSEDFSIDKFKEKYAKILANPQDYGIKQEEVDKINNFSRDANSYEFIELAHNLGHATKTISAKKRDYLVEKQQKEVEKLFKAKEEELTKKTAEKAAKLKAQEEEEKARIQAKEAQRLEAQRLEAEEARRQAEEAERLKAQEEDAKKAREAEEAELKAQEKAANERLKAEEDTRRAGEALIKSFATNFVNKTTESAVKKIEEAKRLEAKKLKAEEDNRRKAEEEAVLKAQQEAQKLADELKAQEAERLETERLEAERLKAEEDAKTIQKNFRGFRGRAEAKDARKAKEDADKAAAEKARKEAEKAEEAAAEKARKLEDERKAKEAEDARKQAEEEARKASELKSQQDLVKKAEEEAREAEESKLMLQEDFEIADTKTDPVDKNPPYYSKDISFEKKLVRAFEKIKNANQNDIGDIFKDIRNKTIDEINSKLMGEDLNNKINKKNSELKTGSGTSNRYTLVQEQRKLIKESKEKTLTKVDYEIIQNLALDADQIKALYESFKGSGISQTLQGNSGKFTTNDLESYETYSEAFKKDFQQIEGGKGKRAKSNFDVSFSINGDAENGKVLLKNDKGNVIDFSAPSTSIAVTDCKNVKMQATTKTNIQQ